MSALFSLTVFTPGRPGRLASTASQKLRDRDRYRVSGSLRDRKDRASLPLAGAPPGGRDPRSGRRGSHRLRDGKAYPRSKKFLGRNIGAVDTRRGGLTASFCWKEGPSGLERRAERGSAARHGILTGATVVLGLFRHSCGPPVARPLLVSEVPSEREPSSRSEAEPPAAGVAVGTLCHAEVWGAHPGWRRRAGGAMEEH